MSDNNSGRSAGLSTTGLLGVVFIVLKLTNVVDWSWWWVLAPFWGGLALALAIALVVAVAHLIGDGFGSAASARRRKKKHGW